VQTPARPATNHLEHPMQFEQHALFPITDIQTDGYAQPEPRNDEAVEDSPELEDAA
jgi:hypothetical protein